MTKHEAEMIAKGVDVLLKHQDQPEGYYYVSVIEVNPGRWLPVVGLERDA